MLLHDKTCCYAHFSTDADLEGLVVQPDIAPLGGQLVELATFLLSYFHHVTKHNKGAVPRCFRLTDVGMSELESRVENVERGLVTNKKKWKVLP